MFIPQVGVIIPSRKAVDNYLRVAPSVPGHPPGLICFSGLSHFSMFDVVRGVLCWNALFPKDEVGHDQTGEGGRVN